MSHVVGFKALNIHTALYLTGQIVPFCFLRSSLLVSKSRQVF